MSSEELNVRTLSQELDPKKFRAAIINAAIELTILSIMVAVLVDHPASWTSSTWLLAAACAIYLVAGAVRLRSALRIRGAMTYYLFSPAGIELRTEKDGQVIKWETCPMSKVIRVTIHRDGFEIFGRPLSPALHCSAFLDRNQMDRALEILKSNVAIVDRSPRLLQG